MIRKIFLSYHFDEESKKLAAKIESLIRSFNIHVVTGEHLAGAILSEQIKKDIAECDALLFILSKRTEGKTNDWVMYAFWSILFLPRHLTRYCMLD